MQVRVEAGELLAGSFTLIPTGENEFFFVQDYAVVTAKFDTLGDVSALRWRGSSMPRVRGTDPR